MARIALVTVLFNSESVLEGFFRSVSIQTFKDYHLFLIDNAPGEKTSQLIDELALRFPVSEYSHIRNAANLGVARGNNQGIEISIAEGYTHTLLLNNDIEFDQNTLLFEMCDQAERQDENLIIPKIYFYDSQKIWMAGGGLWKSRGTVYHVGEGESDGPKYSKHAYFDYAPTCFMLINNKVFESVGLMDEKYFVYYDDTDFIYRTTKRGYKIYFMPNLKVFHKVSSSTGGGESLFAIYYTTRNRLYFLRKNFNGLALALPMTYTFLTRFLRYFAYQKDQRKEMVKGIRDGLLL